MFDKAHFVRREFEEGAQATNSPAYNLEPRYFNGQEVVNLLVVLGVVVVGIINFFFH